MQKSDFDISSLPRFSTIKPEEVPGLIQDILDINRHNLEKLLSQKSYTWENLMQPLEAAHDELNKTWMPISHLHAVAETPPLREAYNNVLPILTEFYTDLGQNTELYNAIHTIATSDAFNGFTPAQKKLLQNELRDFRLAGVNLSKDKKAKLAELQQRLSSLTTKFSENVLDATAVWYYHTTNKSDLAGLPEQALESAAENARLRKLEGYVLTLDFPSYSTAKRFLHDRNLRLKIYEAYSTRASDAGPNAGQWDNTEIMEEILNVRHEIAALTGFANYAEYSLATKMAKTPAEVLAFLNNLLEHSRGLAQQEYAEMQELARKDGITELQAWDLRYYAEKLRMQKYDFSQEDLRVYFPAEKVIQGMFTIVNKIYGITVTEMQGDIDFWHPDVKFYAIHDAQGELRGGVYTDLYARQHKREGAWMEECISRRVLPNDKLQYPVAHLNCNFMPAVPGKPALLTHDDVVTLFHEFGHCLHHVLTKVDLPGVGGGNGVPWDAIEFPSQFMENFCYQRETLALFAAHYETGEPIPDELYQKMVKARNFQTGLQTVRQLEFALFDFRLHVEYQPGNPGQVQAILDDVRNKINVVQTPEFNRFQNTFSHIFAGSYAAGYYSYKWAEVLSADAYAKFEENGVLNSQVGKSFMTNILEVGGVRDPMDAFIAFRGRKPTIDALLKQSGVNTQLSQEEK